MRRHLFPLAFLAACTTQTATPPAAPARDAAADRAAILAADRAFADSTYAHGLDGWMSFYTADAVRLRLGETAHSLLPPGEPATQARWTFAHHTVAAATREDGATFFVLQAKQTDQSDARGIERVTSEFRALRSGA